VQELQPWTRHQGFRATEQQVFCRFFFIEREIPFEVRECTFYEDRRLATKADMEEIAWTLKTMHPTRHVGFTSTAQLSEKEEKAAQTAADSMVVPTIVDENP
jgi:hypothetical protein